MKESTINKQANISAESPLWEELADEAAATCVGGSVLTDLLGELDDAIATSPFSEEGSQFVEENSGTIQDIFQGWINYIDLINSLG